MRTPLARSTVTVAAALTLVLTATLGAAAQTGTPAGGEPGQRGSAYPVAIHQGTCDDPVAQPVGPAIDAGVAGFGDDNPFIGLNIEQPVLVANGDYSGHLAYFTEAPHVIAVHRSAEEFGTIVACGQIAGYDDGGRLIVALRGVESSTVGGVAVLEENSGIVDETLELIGQSTDFGDESVDVAVYIVPGNRTAED